MPTTSTTHSFRAGDKDRERTATLLGLALAQGYLAIDEYEARLQATFGARTAGELHDLVADLPVGALRRDDPARRATRRAAARTAVRAHLWAYLAMVAIVLAVWLAIAVTAGPGYFWPIWPILGGAVGLLGHALPVRLATCGRR